MRKANQNITPVLDSLAIHRGTENTRYFYHGDHLGSSSWITDKDGNALQYISYLPYGQLFWNLKTTSYDASYKFIGKERDLETGFDYFGARYYISPLGVWLSVDPLADKYPSLSPYNYCAGNPLKFVDPNGMDWDRAEDKATANKMDKAAQNRIDLNNTKISEIKGNGGSRGNIRDLKAQNRELEASIKERDFMGNDSKNKYRFEQIEKDGETVIKDGVIVMQYSDEPSAFHEQYHGYREGRGSPYDIYEEVTGYKREFSMLTGNEKVKPGEFLSNGWRYITAPNFAKHVTQLFNSGDDETKKSLGGYMTIIEHWKNQRRY